MKITKLLGLFLIGTMLTACGDEKEDSEKKSESGFKIKAKEFSGTFNISKSDVENDMSYSSNGNDGWSIDFKDKTSLFVNVEDAGFQTHFDELFDQSVFAEYELIEKGDNWAIFKSSRKKIGEDEMVTGYNFLLVTEGPNGKFLRFKGRGEEMFSDIPSEDRARELLKISQDFKLD